MLTRFANPARFMRVSGTVLPFLGVATAVMLAVGLFWSLVFAPPDYQQGETVRIMFIHVPAAWMALQIYLFIAIARRGRAGLAASAGRDRGAAAAPVGAAFTLVCLATG